MIQFDARKINHSFFNLMVLKHARSHAPVLLVPGFVSRVAPGKKQAIKPNPEQKPKCKTRLCLPEKRREEKRRNNSDNIIFPALQQTDYQDKKSNS